MLSSFLWMLSGNGLAAESAIRPPFRGTNCELKQPPAASGEDLTHGVLEKIFPRHTVMPKDYTGCQYVWGMLGEVFSLERAMLFERGELRYFWMLRDNKLPSLICEYRAGALITPVEDCRIVAHIDGP